MNRDALVKLIGFPAILIHGDLMVLDRWMFLRRHLGRPREGTRRAVEIGCGSGAFTIGAALRGYETLGLSWDKAAQQSAVRRAVLCGAGKAGFRINDVRFLSSLSDLAGTCEIVICCETIEHILDDRKLMKDMTWCLKPGGTLLLTSPYAHFKSIGGDEGISDVEDGGHVRRGYQKEDLERLCTCAGLKVTEVGYCSGFLSQKGTKIYRTLTAAHPLAGWLLMLPYRILPLLFDGIIGIATGWPGYSITLVATKL
jgi:SAM-dependent methyltransferase